MLWLKSIAPLEIALFAGVLDFCLKRKRKMLMFHPRIANPLLQDREVVLFTSSLYLKIIAVI